MSRIKIEKDESLNLQYHKVNDTVSELINKINHNLREIQENGGGPMGPIGPIGIPGCRGQSGGPGKDGENLLDEWVAKKGINCNDAYVHDIEDVIMNKMVDRTLMLSNIRKADDIFYLGAIGDDAAVTEFISTNFSDYKLKIYNSDADGKGKHIHLMNSKAVTADINYLCNSGFTISLDWNNNAEEHLKIIGQKNVDISGHMHVFEIDSDLLQLRRTFGEQTLELDAGVGTNNWKCNIKLDTLTSNQNDTIPNKSGFIGVWTDTLEHSEDWEVVEATDLKITYTRYNEEFTNYNVGTFEEVQEDGTHYVDIDNSSVIRFKRMNEWVLIDYHIGISNVEQYDDFYLRNLQLKVNKTSIGCKTIGWHPATVIQDEEFVPPENTFTDHCFFKVSSGDVDESADTFVISTRFSHHNDGLVFVDNLLEEYWLTGQVWATVQSADDSCIEIDVTQEDYCVDVGIE